MHSVGPTVETFSNSTSQNSPQQILPDDPLLRLDFSCFISRLKQQFFFIKSYVAGHLSCWDNKQTFWCHGQSIHWAADEFYEPGMALACMWARWIYCFIHGDAGNAILKYSSAWHWTVMHSYASNSRAFPSLTSSLQLFTLHLWHFYVLMWKVGLLGFVCAGVSFEGLDGNPDGVSSPHFHRIHTSNATWKHFHNFQ